MGLPLEMAHAAGQQHGSGLEFMDAPLRLQVETYEGFSQWLLSLHPDADTHASANVEDDLRKLQIDPAVFYSKAQRVGLRKFTPDDVDALAEAYSGSGAADIGFLGGRDAMAAALALLSGPSPTGVLSDGRLFAPPPRTAECQANDGVLQEERESEQEEPGNVARAVPRLNAPSQRAEEVTVRKHQGEDELEDMLYEEVDFGAETRGGRLGRETPRDLKVKFQVDSLTDDGDEDGFRDELTMGDAIPAEGDAIEAFSLDPDFDYDNSNNLTSKVDEGTVGTRTFTSPGLQ